MFKYFTSKYTVRDIHFLTPAVALMVMHVADLIEQDFNFPDGSKGGTKGDTSENMFLHTFVKQNGAWRITSTQITPVLLMGAQVKAAGNPTLTAPVQ
jgi:hypothetical protein